MNFDPKRQEARACSHFNCGRPSLRRHAHRGLLFLSSLVCASAMPGASAQISYTVTDLGTAGGVETRPHGVNVHDLVVGKDLGAFSWQSGSMSLLPHPGPSPTSEALGVNDAGVIVGWIAGSNFGIPGRRAVVWTTTGPLDLGDLRQTTSTPPFFGDFNEAHGINAAGVVVGGAASDTAATEAFLWQGGAPTALGALHSNGSVARDINNLGDIVGYSWTSFGIREAARFGGPVPVVLPPIAGTNQSIANAVNDAGLAVGYSFTKNGSFENKFATRWTSSGVAEDLTALFPTGQSWINDINGAGMMVGTMGIPIDTHSDGLAFLYDPSGCGLIDLNSFLSGSGSLFTSLTDATSVNENGDIVGWGLHADFTTHGFLLKRQGPVGPGVAPSFTSTDCGQTIAAVAGQPLSLTLCAQDADLQDTVTIDAMNLPAGANVDLSAAEGNPACVVVSWTPGQSQIGTHVIDFLATDRNCNTATCQVTISVGCDFAPGSAGPYGCGLNPADSLKVLGTPEIGQTITFVVDNPVGTQPPGSPSFLIIGVAPDSLYPCGTPGPSTRWGMFLTNNGEILIDFGKPFVSFGFLPIPASYVAAIPSNPALVGVTFYAQGFVRTSSGGVWYGPTNGIKGVIGGCK